MTPGELAAIYRDYIDCLNRQDWDRLADFVDEDAHHNGRRLGVAGYRDMLIGDFETIPDLRFTIDLLVCEPPQVAARLAFDCSPRGRFLGLDVDGRRLKFAENVFYRFAGRKIVDVRSVLDKPAIEAQLD